MYTVSTNFINKIKATSRNVSKCKVDIGTTQVTESSVISFAIENQFSSDNLPSIGGTVAGKLTLKLIRDGITPTYFTTQVIKPYVSLEVTAGVFEYVPLGVFKPNLDNIKKTDASIEIECFDCLTFLESFPYVTTLSYPASTLAVLTEIQTLTGYTVHNIGSLPAGIVKVAPLIEEGASVRTVLGIVAQILTKNVIVNRIGELEFRGLTTVATTMDANNYTDFDLSSDAICSVTMLGTKQRGIDDQRDNNMYAGTTTGATLIIDNININTQAETQVVFNRMFPFSYYAYNLKCQGQPQLDVGDIITLTDVKGVVRKLPIFYSKLEYNGGLMSEFKADAPKIETANSSSGAGGSITQSINKLDIKVFNVEDLLAGNITADNIKANSITAQKLHADVFTAVDAHIKDLTADYAFIEDLEASLIRTTTLEADSATIKNLVAGNITSDNIKANSIVAGDLVAGTITAREIMADVITSALIKSHTIEAINIKALTITASEIAANAIDATKIKAGSIVAGSLIIASGAIGSAQISALDAGKISAGTIDTSKVTIQGTNARMKLTGNRLQVFATKADLSLYERVSLGDVNGDGTNYGLRVRGTDGTTVLMDENGVKREGITDGSINNIKISSDANISGSKLDIASVVTSINGGTTTIASSKVSLGDSSLDVEFSTLDETVGTQGTTIAGHTTKIGSNTTAIGLKVASSTYNTKMTALDAINATTVEELSTHEASIGILEGSITSKVTMTEVTTAKTEAIASASADATSKSDSALASAKTDASAKADTAKSGAISTAALDATTKANGAITTASADATAKSNSAIATASTDATTKADLAQSNAETSAQGYADVVQISTDNAQTTADNAVSDAGTAQASADVAQADINDNAIVVADAITRITTAESSIEQNASSILSKVETTDFNTLSGEVTSNTSQIGLFDKKITFSVEAVTNDLIKSNENIAQIQGYMDFTTEGLVLGKKGSINDNLKVQITNSEMDFIDNGTTVAYISNQQMLIDKAKIETSIQVGNHLIEKYNDEITLFKWIG